MCSETITSLEKISDDDHMVTMYATGDWRLYGIAGTSRILSSVTFNNVYTKVYTVVQVHSTVTTLQLILNKSGPKK